MNPPSILTISLFVLGLGVVPARLAAQETSPLDTAIEACVAADTATRWREVSRAWSAGEGEQGTNDSLRARLLAMGERDQSVRTVAGMADSMQSEGFRRRMVAADSAGAAELMEIVRRHGWPTRRMVGAKAANAAWLIAQHNESMQREVLRMMQALPPGEVSPADLAMLEDRVRVGQGLPQRYGSSLKAGEDGRMRFDPIDDLPGLAARRANAGLPPIPVYICMMRAYSGREVVPPAAP